MKGISSPKFFLASLGNFSFPFSLLLFFFLYKRSKTWHHSWQADTAFKLYLWHFTFTLKNNFAYYRIIGNWDFTKIFCIYNTLLCFSPHCSHYVFYHVVFLFFKLYICVYSPFLSVPFVDFKNCLLVIMICLFPP